MSKGADVQIKPLCLASSEVASLLFKSMLIKLVAQGSLPKLSAGCNALLVEELESQGKALLVSDLPPPANCGFGRAGKAA